MANLCFNELMITPADGFEGIPTGLKDCLLANDGLGELQLEADENHLKASFESAWAPPEEWLKELSAKFPQVQLVISFLEEQADLCGNTTFLGGVITADVTEDYHRVWQIKNGWAVDDMDAEIVLEQVFEDEPDELLEILKIETIPPEFLNLLAEGLQEYLDEDYEEFGELTFQEILEQVKAHKCYDHEAGSDVG